MNSFQVVQGDIFEVPVGTSIVIPVNCVGVAGKGLALEAKMRIPGWARAYQSDCKAKRIAIGSITTYKTEGWLVINLPTKNHWSFPSEYEYIRVGLASLLRVSRNFKQIALPALGCGEGSLEWDEVLRMLKLFAQKAACGVLIYEPMKEVENVQL
jgi:O-acetyl-ADP-ribose deacetylase (regulator of RNase III)